MTKNRTPTPVYLDPAMHPGLEVKGLKITRNHLSRKSATSTEGRLVLDQLPSQEINYQYHGIARIIFEMRLYNRKVTLLL